MRNELIESQVDNLVEALFRILYTIEKANTLNDVVGIEYERGWQTLVDAGVCGPTESFQRKERHHGYWYIGTDPGTFKGDG